MDLILWRHAEAHEAEPGQSDLDRALTGRGERQARRMAAWLNRLLPASTRVLASPARRTQQTVQALDRRFKTVPELAPDAEPAALLQAARWPDAREPVLIVGHQPTLGLAASALLAGHAEPWPLRKGAVIWLRRREREGQPQLLLHAAMSPELL
ncbi:MAG: histidine phosphatase family protein [Rubrivivax sp.]